MKTIRRTVVFSTLFIVITGLTSCSVWNKAFAPKRGCPTNGKAFGAEKILSGEKPPKTRKFKA
ncbi:MAG TPA: hypothetical protein VK618_03560 [Flavitalea sp.]|nr:hypothetical protein [Flavitalea sp.]